MDLDLEKANNDEEDWDAGTDADEDARDGPKKRSNKSAKKTSKESPNKKRKREEEVSEKERPRKLLKREESRLRGAPAYIYMVLADGGPAFKWRDESGQAASGRSVEYLDGLTAESAFVEALHWHDAYEQRRFTEYNKEVLMAIARRRVPKWAESAVWRRPLE